MNLSRIKQKVAGLPQEAGVYFFYGKAKSALGGQVKRGSLLYIGKATNLRTRVASYFRTDSKLPASTVGGRMNANGANMQMNANLQADAKLRMEYESTNKGATDTNLQIEQLEQLEHLQHPEHLERLQHLQQLERSVVPGRSEWIGSMMPLVEEIEFEQTDSVLEALILESNLIKKHQPKYNTLEKDDKSFAYFVITKEEFPRVLIVRKTDIQNSHQPSVISNQKNSKFNKSKFIRNSKFEIQNSGTFGPYASKQQMQIALKIIRRIFPFHAGKQKTEKGCLDFQLGLCPGPYAGAISKEDYKKNIDGIKLILAGKKKSLLSGLEKEMKALAKDNEFEKAAEVRNKIFALEHIRDVALITRSDENFQFPCLPDRQAISLPTGQAGNFQKNPNDQNFNLESVLQAKKLMPEKLNPVRIEAYDISNISGTDAVGSMVVFVGGEPDKSQYRKFKIKTIEGSNDVAMMKEVLLRRFKNDWPASTRGDDRSSTRGWPMPDLILLDGGQGHVNAINDLIVGLGLDVLVVGVAKGKTRKNLNFQFPISNKIPMTQFPKQLQDFLNDKNLVKSIMDEAHRFAITFHRKLRGKRALNS